MARVRMHEGEVGTSPQLLRTLLQEQFPDWAALPLTLVESYGTDHDIYRVGDELSVRMPHIGWAMAQADLEAEWLPRLAPHLPLALPTPVAIGEPGHGYPYRWAVHRWLAGANANQGLGDLDRAARDLGAFVRALQTLDTTGAPARKPGAKGSPVAELDAAVRERITEMPEEFDQAAMLRVWDDAIAADPWPGPDVWLHTDLLPGNLLVDDGRLTAVIDWGGLSTGDPAADLRPVWNTFRGSSGRVYLDAVGADDAMVRRARGWVIAGSIFGIPYYWTTNPGIVEQSKLELAAVLAEAHPR